MERHPGKGESLKWAAVTLWGTRPRATRLGVRLRTTLAIAMGPAGTSSGDSSALAEAIAFIKDEFLVAEHIEASDLAVWAGKAGIAPETSPGRNWASWPGRWLWPGIKILPLTFAVALH